MSPTVKGSEEEKYEPIAICRLLLEIIPGATIVYLRELRSRLSSESYILTQH